MLKKLNWFKMLVIAFVILVTVAACDDGNNEPLPTEPTPEESTPTEPTPEPPTPPTPPPTAPTIRYETEPYSNNTNGSAGNSAVNNLIFSGYDDEKYYYVFLLGNINHVPITYRDAIRYEGIAINIEYTKAEFTEESVTQSMTTTVVNSVSESSTTRWGVEAGIKIKMLFNIKGSYGGSESWDSTNTRSTANTYEVTTRKMNEIRETVSYTVGERNEPYGKYRWTLFGVVDVYYVLEIDKQMRFVNSYFSVCARDSSMAWGIDYEPDFGGSFGKTGTGELLSVPVILLSNLSIPVNEIVSLTDTPEPLPPEEPTPPLKTSYTESRSIGGNWDINAIGKDNRDVIERFRPDLPILELKQSGYTQLQIKVSFAYRAEALILGGNLRLRIANHNDTRELGRSDFSRQLDWTRASYQKTVPINNTDNNTGEFLVIWNRAERGDFFNWYTEFSVGNRTITITALR
ncbi:MAG: hypothetical protein LBH16_01645 [Treponema sp.]|jgi:hypothetical protein|nr:hypothetical protein [Treponema sp.]